MYKSEKVVWESQIRLHRTLHFKDEEIVGKQKLHKNRTQNITDWKQCCFLLQPRKTNVYIYICEDPTFSFSILNDFLYAFTKLFQLQSQHTLQGAEETNVCKRKKQATVHPSKHKWLRSLSLTWSRFPVFSCAEVSHSVLKFQPHCLHHWNHVWQNTFKVSSNTTLSFCP